jgi:adenylate cyclase
MGARNETVPEHRRMRFRIGINLGDVVHDDTRIHGDGINIAARLEALSDPGGVLVSRTVHEQVHGKLPVAGSSGRSCPWPSTTSPYRSPMWPVCPGGRRSTCTPTPRAPR